MTIYVTNYKYLFPSTAFVAGFSLMTVELTSTRILAPYVGMSVYTWTAAIGVILLGLSIGNYLGGYLIDKYRSLKIISYFFILSSLSTAFIPFLAGQISFFVLNSWSLPIIIVIITAILFLLPSIFMGALYPAILKFYSENLESLGIRAGVLSALWSLGSIIGVFATGFYFIGYLGSNTTVFLIAVLLFVSGLFFYRPKIGNLIILFIVLITAIYSSLLTNAKYKGVFNRESNYYNIRVVDTSYNDDFYRLFGKARILFLDFDSHSVESLDRQSIGTYPEIYPVFSVLNPNIKDILVLGGGSYSIVKKFFNFYKDSQITAVEIDPAVVETAEKFFDLKSYPIKTAITDGRVFLKKNTKKYDLIFSDTYNSFVSVPWHLTTEEFNDLIKMNLTSDGIYAVNFISALSGKNSAFFQSMLATFKKTFDNYQMFSFGGSFPTDPQSIILVGINSDYQWNPEELKGKLKLLPNGAFLSSNLITQIFAKNDEIFVLNDNFAPVERLMTPLINDYLPIYAALYYSFLKN